MKSLKGKVILPLVLIVVISIISSVCSIISINRVGNAGDEIVKKNVPVIISLDAISANIEEMQQLLLNYSSTGRSVTRLHTNSSLPSRTNILKITLIP